MLSARTFLNSWNLNIVSLTTVLYTPKLKANIVDLGRLDDHARKCVFHHSKMQIMKRADYVSCRDCVSSIQARAPFSSSFSSRSSQRLQEIFTFSDDYSRTTWVAMLQKKFVAPEAFKKFKAMAEAEKKEAIGCYRTCQDGA